MPPSKKHNNELKSEMNENVIINITESDDKKRGKNTNEPHIVKKRGRKPNKDKPVEDLSTKKIKKQKESYGLVSLSSKESSVRELDNPILFLNLKPHDIEQVEKSFFEYNIGDYKPEIIDPSPFDPDDENFHPLGGNPKTMIQNEELETKPDKREYLINKSQNNGNNNNNNNNDNNDNEMSENDYQMEQINNRESSLNLVRYQKYTPMMKLYMETNMRETWPEVSNYNCLWEYHPFEGTPWGIPYKYENNKFYCRPNFCSPGCASAYLFKNYEDDDVWEKYSLLNMLYQKVINDPNRNIIPAPTPECLKSNGGFLDLDEFRNIAWQGNREFVIQMPPMVAIIPTAKLQENNRSFSENMEPIYKKRLNEACDELRYKRNKPLTDRNNSLHHYFDSIRAGQV